MNKILIVDDEPNIVMTLEYAFKRKNFQVFIARDGSEALEIMEKAIPDIVILDIMMPKVDGFQTLNYIKRQEKFNNIKVVFLTAKTKIDDIEKGLQMGADLYLTKPFSVKKVVSEINQLL